ncbi:hypothetical protein CHS0354_005542 [Potamilus streckersoni]|uniref:Uncharacterized protein n=1 Tax=Potamilus streckersoni TaxID=2493646 RepID=A0AAE0RNN1_9BIVA|nr:hypothetical protein CHS0354_005542 [Potamilus streckersoni]
MEKYERLTGNKAKYPKSNHDLEELEKEIHSRKSQPVDKEPDKITRHQKALKLVNDYEKAFGKKPKYTKSNTKLMQIQNEFELDKKSKLKIKQILSSFSGFSKTYQIEIETEPLENLIKSAIDYILIKEPRIKIIVELRVTFIHAVDSDKFTLPYIKPDPKIVYAYDEKNVKNC